MVLNRTKLNIISNILIGIKTRWDVKCMTYQILIVFLSRIILIFITLFGRLIIM